MARPPKFPGLQERFNSALSRILTSTTVLKAREIVEAINNKRDDFRISELEVADLRDNFANYADRAKKANVISSSGPWGGYSLVQTTSPKVMEPSGTAGTQATSATKTKAEQWEAFLHLPLTIALSQHFGSRVRSLPTAIDSVRWGNPDMLMLRASPIAAIQDIFGDDALDASVFRRVDVTPDCILSSLEIKGGLDRDRARMFQAVAEAAANSRWANEGWLIFVDWLPSDKPLDDDVLSLARSVELGIIEVRLIESQGSVPSALRTVVHHEAPLRPTIRVGEMNAKRAGLLRAAQDLIQSWDSETPTFLDVNQSEQKMRVLLSQAIENLRDQKGFTGGGTLATALAPLEQADATYVRQVLDATLRGAAIAAGTELDPKKVNSAVAAALQAHHDLVSLKALRDDMDYLSSGGAGVRAEPPMEAQL